MQGGDEDGQAGTYRDVRVLQRLQRFEGVREVHLVDGARLALRIVAVGGQQVQPARASDFQATTGQGQAIQYKARGRGRERGARVAASRAQVGIEVSRTRVL